TVTGPDGKERVHNTVILYDDAGNTDLLGGSDVDSFLAMTRREKRALIESAFGRPLRGGKPPGVYVSPAAGSAPYGPTGWDFTLRGQLAFECVVPWAVRPEDETDETADERAPGGVWCRVAADRQPHQQPGGERPPEELPGGGADRQQYLPGPASQRPGR